jgi:hypothetical protein
MDNKINFKENDYCYVLGDLIWIILQVLLVMKRLKEAAPPSTKLHSKVKKQVINAPDKTFSKLKAISPVLHSLFPI